MNVVCDNKTALTRKYVPFPLGNGDLSFQIDYEGGMKQTAYCGMTPTLVRAGYRYDNYWHNLVEFGFFESEIEGSGDVKEWTQSFDFDSALCKTNCLYENGIRAETEIFCHLEHNIIVIRKKLTGGTDPRLHFRYTLNPKRTKIVATSDFQLRYEIDTVNDPKGMIELRSDKECERTVQNGDTYVMTFSEREFTIFMAVDPAAAWLLAKQGFDGLLETQKAAWKRFWDASTLNLPDGPLKTTCRTAEYHLRISSTKWSIPTGIFPGHWHGKYFAFDEFFACSGLIATGHLEEAKKIPMFRASILEFAKKRAHFYFGKVAPFAKYQWETLETPMIEGAPQGFWVEHIFHTAHIALETAKYYEASQDLNFLKEHGYQVIRGCAEFYRIQGACELGGGRVIIGKCTDLERLGPARENAFMTTCSAVATLRAAAHYAKKLNEDADMIPVWEDLGERLLANLPSENGRYIPYPGCKETSIATLSGLYPYKVLPVDDPKQLMALKDFCDNESTCGNMYPLGKSICVWYAGWKCMALARLGRKEEGMRVLEQCALETGCFSEIFEIYESGSHPWFTTGEGIFLEAVQACM